MATEKKTDPWADTPKAENTPRSILLHIPTPDDARALMDAAAVATKNEGHRVSVTEIARRRVFDNTER